MKKSCIMLFGLLFVICCYGCERTDLVLPKNIEVILKYNGIESADVIHLADYTKYSLNYDLIDMEETEVADSEVAEYVNMQMEAYAKLREITKRSVVQKGDVAIVSYLSSLDGNIVNEVSSDILMVGKGNYDQQFENVLIGKTVGVPFSEKLISPTGEEMEFSILVESINYYDTVQLTDEFVRQEMGVSSVEEYYEACKTFIFEEKIQVEKEKLKESLFREIIDSCEISLDTEEIARFSLQYVETEERIAYIYGLSLQEYIDTILQEDRSEFFQQCYENGEFEIQKYMLIGAIFYDLQYSIADGEVEAMCEQLKYDYSNTKEHEYQYALVEFAIMEQKVLNYFESDFSMRN